MNFYEKVIQNDVRYLSRQRISDPVLLEPVFKGLIYNIMGEASKLGKTLGIVETYRSLTRQKELFDKGVTKLNKVSVHHFGLACDIILIQDGKTCWDADYKFMEALALRHNLIWGGNWGKIGRVPDFYDAFHLQRCSTYKQKELFNGTWYPEDSYNAMNDQLAQEKNLL